MNYETLEGLSLEELVNLYDNVIEDGTHMSDRQVYARVTCDNGKVFSNKTFCTSASGFDNDTSYTRYEYGGIRDKSRSVGGVINQYSHYWCSCMHAGCYDDCTVGQGCEIVGIYNGYCGLPNNGDL